MTITNKYIIYERKKDIAINGECVLTFRSDFISDLET
jgi:hypothetical protein